MYGVFDGHGGGEVAKYTKRHYEELLQEIEEYKSTSDIKEGLRLSFLKVDESLVAGGLDEVKQIKKDNPPTKSPLFKVLGEITNKKK